MYKHLTAIQRSQIELFLSNGCSIRAIADRMNRSPSTISREIARNKLGPQYCGNTAHTLSTKRRSETSSKPHKMTPGLMAVIEKKLRRYWSPVQISGWLKKQGIFISHESIYKFVAAKRVAGSDLYTCLRHKGRRYRSRTSKTAGRGIIPNRILINKRSKIVEDKARIGDWEADTIIGKNHQGALVTLVDRCSKITLLAFVRKRTAAAVTQAIINRLKQIPASYRKKLLLITEKHLAHIKS